MSVKRHLAVTNVSNHWYLFTQWSMIKDSMEYDQRQKWHFSALVLHALRSTLYGLRFTLARSNKIAVPGGKITLLYQQATRIDANSVINGT